MTRTLTLKNRFQGNTTIVENDFIDHYMAKANGEYVKVYLLLLRHLNANSGNLSICGLADCLECTEKDILRAFTHWSDQGLLKIDYDDAGNICGLAIGKPVPKVAPKDEVSKDAPRKVVPSKPVRKDSKDQEDLRQLYFVAEQYVGKPLTVSEIKKINYFFDTLGFSTDLIEYLIEYCVENGHRTFRYIESVALSWADAGIASVEDAKLNTLSYNKNYYSILNAFGIKGRSPAPVELEYMKKWLEQYGFTLEVILEACNRTIANTHKPDFKYTDSILKNWSTNGVTSFTDITQLDLTFQQQKANGKKTPAKVPAKTRFSNFEGRTYDMKSLEQQLLNINR
ncbi:MAG: DnaD domain protein [Tyzzerella sp.]|nr:DnaD domain protein [Tyzzerella sp.]